MPHNGTDILYAIPLLLAFVWIGYILYRIAKRLLGKKFGPVKTVSAKVVDKSKSIPVSPHPGFKQEICYVVFSVNGKRKGFRVSGFSYNGYRVGETGTLKYQGDRLIDFH